MGLLDRALTLESPEKDSLFSPNLEKMFLQLSESSEGLDFPSQLHSVLRREFNISKGALLLPDANKLFIPWAITGFDQTTSRRIRIPHNIIISFQDDNSSVFIELKNDEIKPLKDYFSFREYSVTSHILISIIETCNRIVAVLFVTEGEILNQSVQVKEDLLLKLSELAGPLLLEKRENILNKFSEKKSKGENLESIIKTWIDIERKNFLLIKINIESFLNEIRKKDGGSIKVRLMEDIKRLVMTLIGDRGELSSIDSNSFAIIIGSSRPEEADLFIHQIGLSLSFFYKIDNKLFNPICQILNYPADGENAIELIQKITP